MTAEKKVKYLKIDRGRYYYQRRVPDQFRELLGISKWQMPCGDVSYAKAVQLVVNWAEEHDDLLTELKTPEGYDAVEVDNFRSEDMAAEKFIERFGGTPLYSNGDDLVPLEDLSKPWMTALEEVAKLDEYHSRAKAPEHEVLQLQAKILGAKRDGSKLGKIKLTPYPEFIKLAQSYSADTDLVEFEFTQHPPRPMSDELYLYQLNSVYQLYFGAEPTPPSDPDDRDEYVFAKHRIERKISSVTPDKDSITAVLEKYCKFNSIRSGTRSKYRREVARLVAITGDVPMAHVRSEDLKQLRDQLIGTIQAASIQAIFTPIKGIFAFAFDEDIIPNNPMLGVKLPKDKRPIEERKWKSFTPSEVTQILGAAKEVWSAPVQGLSDARREAIHMVVRVLTYSGMRPVEVIRLKSDDVTDSWIHITGSKTESSTRVVPLHPEIADFPAWVASGGLETFQTIKTDQVGSVRHNFGQLLRKKMQNPITDPQKALYSLRSTFVNAMRRAGADIQVQRAILGHKEAGAIRHYYDGQEFEVKRKWVEATDPRQ
ncbi:tyrosine-type recombinase/integrase [uncultured Tateyamaria sp.]|uniref:tyrosine-type recombinase/integrase n=1 Tax=uncultured Tateyamaria sp. TaxID=455651 RepID=UPI0026329B62|nr:tyrosine-type recombinase/integrase [uncultured Tateyamaria sp.]